MAGFAAIGGAAFALLIDSVPVVSAKTTLSGFRCLRQRATSRTAIKGDLVAVLIENPLRCSRLERINSVLC